MARCSRSSSISSTSSPARTASIVIRVSTPNPIATGKTASRARALRRRWPESGSRSERPQRSSIKHPGGALRDPESPARSRPEDRDRDVGALRRERAQVASEVRIAQEERPGLELSLGERQRLALATTRQPDHARTRLLGRRRRPVARAVVGDDDRGIRKLRV